MTRTGARTALSQAGMTTTSQRAQTVPAERYYTVLSEEEPCPFGFGSPAPARPEPKFPDVPGPGRYDPRFDTTHFESIRGHGNGFTSKSKRKNFWSTTTRTPGPAAYSPTYIEKRTEPAFSIGPLCGRRCSCYPDEKVASQTPGPSDYHVETSYIKKRGPSSVFKSRTERSLWGTTEKKKPRFDGRTLIIPFGY